MNDRDQSLQDEFDRYFQGDGSLPDAENDPDAAAYQMVFEALQEEPDGDLSDDFAEQVADRVGVGTEPSIAWSDVLLIFLVVAGLGTAVVMMPSMTTLFDKTTWSILRSVQDLSVYIRLDVIGAAGLVLALTLGFDTILRRWMPLRRAPTPT